jgi:hypothetical protein
VGGEVKYRLSSSKASYTYLVHWNLSFCLRSLKEGTPLTPSLDMNLLKCAMHPVNLCTSWRLLGGFIIVIADTFSGLGSIHVGNTYTQVVFLRVDQMYTSQDSTSC